MSLISAKTNGESSSTGAAGLSEGQISDLQLKGEFNIKSEAVTPQLGKSHYGVGGNLLIQSDTSQWPLLLKNYDKLLVRSSHFTPIPTVRS